MKRLLLLTVEIGLGVGISLDCHATAPSTEDHLVPVKEALGLSAIYQELWERKLLLSPGETARFVSLPGTVGVETAISVYQAPGKQNSLPGNYWVTVTQATERLWGYIEPGNEHRVDPLKIPVERCDAPIAAPAAIAMHKVWLTMLERCRPQEKSNEILVDSSREIVSAVDARGVVLRGESSTTPKENSKALTNIARSLMEYCEALVAKRAEIESNIEETACNLLARIESAKDLAASEELSDKSRK